MRVLCVSRHQFLSEHLCRYFGELGATCEGVVGIPQVVQAAVRFEPHVVVSDSDLMTPALLDQWVDEPALADVPVLAVSLTRRPHEGAASVLGDSGAIYLPGLGRDTARAVLEAAYRPRGVEPPAEWHASDLPATPTYR